MVLFVVDWKQFPWKKNRLVPDVSLTDTFKSSGKKTYGGLNALENVSRQNMWGQKYTSHGSKTC